MEKKTVQKPDKNPHVKRIRGGILAAAILLILLGIFQNGAVDVKNKAVRICYECIGIG